MSYTEKRNELKETQSKDRSELIEELEKEIKLLNYNKTKLYEKLEYINDTMSYFTSIIEYLQEQNKNIIKE